MPSASEAWVRVIQEGKGYSGIDASRFRRLIDQTKKNYALYKVLRRHVANGSKVLEAGCGWACSSFALAEDGISVTAIDISEKLIEDLKEVQKELGGPAQSNLKLLPGDIFKLAELREKFDVIFNDGTYEHFLNAEDRKTILRDTCNQLKQNGKYIVAVPNVENPFFRWVVDPKMPAMQPFSLKTLAAELEAGGFQVIEQGYQFVNPGFEQWLKSRWMAQPVWMVNGAFGYFPKFLKKTVAAHIYCVAQKSESENR